MYVIPATAAPKGTRDTQSRTENETYICIYRDTDSIIEFKTSSSKYKKRCTCCMRLLKRNEHGYCA